MRTRVKVCCMASVAEARAATRLGADALGLVGPMPSGPGTIDDALAGEIAASVPPPVATVLLTSETTAKAITQHVRRVQPTAVQVVAHIAPAEAARLARTLRPSTKVIQVIHVEGDDALRLIPTYAAHADAFLLDSGKPSASVPELGGTGRVHDWDVSAAFVGKSPLPVFLAGGLTSENAAEAIRAVRPYGLDLCSGVRTNGSLDEVKLEAFMSAVANA